MKKIFERLELLVSYGCADCHRFGIAKHGLLFLYGLYLMKTRGQNTIPPGNEAGRSGGQPLLIFNGPPSNA